MSSAGWMETAEELNITRHAARDSIQESAEVVLEGVSRRPRLVKSAVFGDVEDVDMVYGKFRHAQISQITDLFPQIVTASHLDEYLSALKDLEVIFGTWGMPRLTHEQIDRLPNLKVIFFAAGSVQRFAKPFLERGVTVISAWQANAVPVAEFTLSQILLATKGYFRNSREFRCPQAFRPAYRGPGNFGETIALLGCGAIGTKVAELLAHFRLNVIAYDPFISDEKAAALNLTRVSLEEAFARGFVVSNHLADLPETKGLFRRKHFGSMRAHATFINTGRGATVDESALIEVFEQRPDLTALLDVTFPEPPVSGSALYTLPNVHLSTHLAGSRGDELARMADFCIEEFVNWCNGRISGHAVSLSKLDTMA